MRAAAMRHRTFDEDSLCLLVNSKNVSFNYETENSSYLFSVPVCFCRTPGI